MAIMMEIQDFVAELRDLAMKYQARATGQRYGVATISRLLEITCLFCKRAL